MWIAPSANLDVLQRLRNPRLERQQRFQCPSFYGGLDNTAAIFAAVGDRILLNIRLSLLVLSERKKNPAISTRLSEANL